mgnify:CR=1 FL=1
MKKEGDEQQTEQGNVLKKRKRDKHKLKKRRRRQENSREEDTQTEATSEQQWGEEGFPLTPLYMKSLCFYLETSSPERAIMLVSSNRI